MRVKRQMFCLRNYFLMSGSAASCGLIISKKWCFAVTGVGGGPMVPLCGGVSTITSRTGNIKTGVMPWAWLPFPYQPSGQVYGVFPRKLVGTGAAGKGFLSGKAWGSGLISLNTAGVPLPNPLISNIIMCLRNSPTLEQEAQKGPQVFVPPWQQAGYPPKQSPIPSTRLANWTATIRRKTNFVDSMAWGVKKIFRQRQRGKLCACRFVWAQQLSHQHYQPVLNNLHFLSAKTEGPSPGIFL